MKNYNTKHRQDGNQQIDNTHPQSFKYHLTKFKYVNIVII